MEHKEQLRDYLAVLDMVGEFKDHYLSNHVAVAYGDIFDEMVAPSLELGFKERVLGKQA